MDTNKLQTLEGRLNAIDVALARAQGTLLATQDVLAAIIRADPEKAAAALRSIQPRKVPNPFVLQGYQQAYSALAQTTSAKSTPD